MSPTPLLTLRVPSLEATHAVAGALAGLSRSGDIVVLAGEMGAGKTAFAQGFGRALGVTEPITSPTFTLVHSYDTGHRHAAPRRPVPPRAAGRGRRSGSRRAGRVPRHRARRVGRRRRVHVRRAPARAPRPRRRRARRPRRSRSPPSARRGPSGGPRSAGPRPSWPCHEPTVLTRHADPGHRDGDRAGQRGARRARGRDRPVRGGPRPAPRRDPHAGHRVRLRPGRHRARRDRARRRRRRARAVHRDARRPGRRQGAGPGAAGADDRDLLARPAGVPAPRGPTASSCPSSTPARARCSTPCTARCPAGCSRWSAPQVGPIDDLVADLLARSQEALCVGDGALRYRAEILEGFHCEIADDAHPSAGPLVQLAHARALREEWVSPSDIRPVYLRQPDAQINWATPRPALAEDPGWRRRHDACCERRASPAVAGSSIGPAPGSRRSSRCATATSSQVLAIEEAVVPQAVERRVFHDELDQARDGLPRRTSWPARVGPSSATAG